MWRQSCSHSIYSPLFPWVMEYMGSRVRQNSVFGLFHINDLKSSICSLLLSWPEILPMNVEFRCRAMH